MSSPSSSSATSQAHQNTQYSSPLQGSPLSPSAKKSNNTPQPSLWDRMRKTTKKSPPYMRFQNFAHESVFISGRTGNGVDNGLNISFQKPFSASQTFQASVLHNTMLGFTPGMGMKPTAQHTLGLQIGSQLGNFQIETQLPHLSHFSYAMSAQNLLNKKLQMNLHVQDAKVQGRVQRDLGGSITYRGADYVADLDGSLEQKKFRFTFMQQQTDKFSMGSYIAYNNRPSATDLGWVAHYLVGEKNSPKFLASLEQKIEDHPDKTEMDRSMNNISKLALTQRVTATTYVANELTMNWTRQTARLKYGVKQSWPTGGEMRVMADDEMRVNAYYEMNVLPTVMMGLRVTASPSQDEYKVGMMLNIVDAGPANI